MPITSGVLSQFNMLYAVITDVIGKLRTTAEEMGYPADWWLDALKRTAGPYGATTLRNIVRVIMGENMFAITEMTWQQLVDSCNFVWIDKRFTEKRWPIKVKYIAMPPNSNPKVVDRWQLTTSELVQGVSLLGQLDDYNDNGYYNRREEFGSDKEFAEHKKRVDEDRDRRDTCGINEVLRWAPEIYLNPEHAGISFVIPTPVKVGRRELFPVIVDTGGGKSWQLRLYAMDETAPGFVLWFTMWRKNPPTKTPQ